MGVFMVRIYQYLFLFLVSCGCIQGALTRSQTEGLRLLAVVASGSDSLKSDKALSLKRSQLLDEEEPVSKKSFVSDQEVDDQKWSLKELRKRWLRIERDNFLKDGILRPHLKKLFETSGGSRNQENPISQLIRQMVCVSCALTLHNKDKGVGNYFRYCYQGIFNQIESNLSKIDQEQHEQAFKVFLNDKWLRCSYRNYFVSPTNKKKKNQKKDPVFEENDFNNPVPEALQKWCLEGDKKE